MLAQPGPGTPPDGVGWLHEIKWDGVRAILTRAAQSVVLRSRSGRDMAASYPEIAAAADSLEPGVILDGEIVALGDDGAPSFELLQQRMNIESPAPLRRAIEAVPVTYVVFDQLHDPAAGSLLELSLERRLEMLGSIELPAGCARSESYAEGNDLWEFVRNRGIEGVVSKRAASPYRPGVRSPDWIKSVAFKSLRAVVGGFTEGEGGRHGGFGALVLGLMAGERLRWIGSVGSGFTEAAVRAIRGALDEMTIEESPFESAPVLPPGITWVSPALVAIVQYREWTSAGRLRGPSFKGFAGEPVESITWETEGPGTPGG